MSARRTGFFITLFAWLAITGCGSDSSANGTGGKGGSGNASGSGGKGGTGGGSGGSGGGTGASGGTGGVGGSGGAGVGFSCAKADPGPLTPTYYVDFGAGDDAADGKSQATPWKHAPGDASAAGKPASVALAAGDVVLFKGGVAYKGTIDVPSSGTAQAPIVYDGNSRTSWGNGSAIIDGELTRSAGITLSDKSYVLIDSFEIKSFDKAESSVGVRIEGGSNDEVRNCRISDVYYPTNPGGTSWESQSGTGIAVNNSPATQIHHNFVRDVGNAGITFTAGSGVVVDGGQIACNEITNMNWGIAIALGNSTPGTKITNVAIVGNYIHDFDQYYVSDSWHRDGIFVFARPDTDQATVENLEIAGNYFEDNSSDLGSTAWIYLEFVCKNFKIHHNVLNASRSYYAIRVLGDGFQVEGNHLFANNVIANTNGIGAGMHIQESSGITLKNNIFYDDDYAYIIAQSSMPGFSADYNLFYRSGSGPIVALNAGPAEAPGGDKYDLPALQAANQDQHGVYGDPMFSTPFASIDADPTGFLPASGSPAIDKGTDLGYTSDFSGNPLPVGAAPDIGAFERQP